MITPVAHEPEPPKTKTDVTAGLPHFRWPVNGRVIAAFGPKPSGQQNDGINVSVPEGTPIKAAGTGVILTAGFNSGGYGNMTLINHGNILWTFFEGDAGGPGLFIFTGHVVMEVSADGFATSVSRAPRTQDVCALLA